MSKKITDDGYISKDTYYGYKDIDSGWRLWYGRIVVLAVVILILLVIISPIYTIYLINRIFWK